MACVMLLLLTCASVFGQYRPAGYITLGNGTESEYHFPICTYYNYSYAQQIYTAEDIQASLGNTPNTITGIAFHWINTTTVPYPLTVYMGNTTRTDFPSTSATANDFIPVSDLTQVFSGNVSMATGWVTINFSTPFEWDGNSNIVVAVNATKGSYSTSSNPTFSVTSSGDRKSTLSIYRDGTTPFNPATIASDNSSTRNSYTKFPDIRFYCTVDCEAIMGLTASNITSDGATISWNALAEAEGVEFEYRRAGEASYTPVPNVTGTSYTFAGLDPITNYDVRVRTNCGNGLHGTWENVSFKTGCGILTIAEGHPYQENFDGYAATEYYTAGTMPDCWDVIYTGTSANYAPHVYTGSSYAPTVGSKCLFLHATSSSSYGPRTYAILPEMTNSLNTLRVNFAYSQYSSSNYGHLSLGYVTDETDSTTFVELLALPHAYYSTNRYNAVEYDILNDNIPAGARIAFRYTNTTSNTDYVFIEDLTVNIQPSCLKPMDLNSANITASSVDLSWTARTGETAWEIDYNGARALANANPFTLTGLTDNTDYTVRVRAICAAGDTSDWSDETSFHTLCVPQTITDNAPYFEDFSTYTPVVGQDHSTPGDIPDCWSYIFTGTSNNYSPAVYKGAFAVSGDTCFAIVSGGSATYGYDNYAILPLFTNPLTDLQLEFGVTMEGGYGTLYVGYITGQDTSDFVSLFSLNAPAPSSGADEYEIPFGTYATSIPANARIAFKYGDLESSYRTCALYDVRVRITPSCLKPIDLASANITASSADLSWTARTEETAWEIDYNGTRMSVNANPFTLTGLTDNTDYTVRVRAICAEGDTSDWSNPITFRTLCTGFTITEAEPYTENFDSYTAVSYSTSGGVMPDCWNYIYTGTSASYNPHVSTSNSYCPVASSQSLFLCAYNSTSYGPRTYVVLPEFTNPLNTLQIAFAYAHYSSSAYSKLSVGYMTDWMDSTTYVELATVPHAYYYTNRYNEFEYNIQDADIPAGARLALRSINTTSNSDYTFIDDLVVRIQPTCLRPTGLTVTRMDSTEVELSWTENGDATEWEIEYGNANFVQGTGTRTVITSNPCTISGLTYGSSYDAYVRAICTVGDSSFWSVKTTFTLSGCTPAPTSVDGQGISNITFGAVQVVNSNNHPHSSPYYRDNTSMVGDVLASEDLTVNITFATGYDYGTVIWVNWNNDLSFTDDEVVYTGHSTSSNPTTLSCVIPIPANTPVGQYTMRIGTADSGLDSQISNGSGYTPCYSGSWATFEDYTLEVLPVPTCPRPGNLTVSNNTTGVSAVISWDAVGEESTWLVNLNDSVFEVTTNPYTLALSENTDYTVSVAAYCDITDTSYYCSAVSFTTPCVATTITEQNPFVENFNSYTASSSISTMGDQPSCWDFIHTGASGYENYAPHVYVGTYSPNANSNALVMTAGYSYSYGTTSIAILPAFTNDLTTLQLLFKARMESATSGTLYMGYITNINDASTFTSLYTVPGTSTGTSYLKDLSQYTIPSNARLAFKWYYTDIYYSVALDDISVRIALDCQDVSDIHASNITANSTEIGWTVADSTQNQWEISYNGTTVTATSNPFTITGLTGNTDYTVNVRAICDENEYSYWTISDYTFTTMCDPILLDDTTVYFDDFESYANSTSMSDEAADKPDCWSTIFTGSTAGYASHVYSSTTYAPNNGKVLVMTTATSSTYDTNSYAVLPAFTNALEDLELDFDAAVSSVSYHQLLLGYVTDITDGSTFVQLEQLTPNAYSAGYTHYEIYPAQYNQTIPAGARLAFCWHATSSSSYYAFVDNVRVRIAPSCLRPQNVVITNIGLNDVTVGWTSVGEESQWEVVVGDIDTIVSTNPATITGLDATTYYNVNVRAICDANDQSDWTDTTDFMTLCDAITITREDPYTEDFQSYESTTSYSTFSEQPDCWDFIFTGTGSGYAPHVYNGTYAPSGNNSLVMTSGSETYGSNNYAILPLFTNALNSLEVSFKVKMESSSYGTLYAGYLTNAADASTFVSLETIPNTTTGTSYTYTLNEQTFPANARLAFKWSYSSSYYCVAIDDIVINLACETPTDVAVDEYNTITWNDPNESGLYNLTYVINGDTTSIVAHNNIYTLSNVPDNADVAVMVQAVCDATHSSAWTEPYYYNTGGDESDTIGIANYELLTANVFPNPTTGNVRVQLNHHFNLSNAEVQICDMYGRKLFAREINADEFDLDMTGYANGVYFIRIINDNAILKNVKVVKE